MITVLVADDQDMVRGALLALLGLEPDIDVVADVARGDLVVPAVLRTAAEVAVLDIDMPGIDGLDVAARLAEEAPATRVLILTGFGAPGHVRRALDAHVAGFLRKNAPSSELADAIRRVHGGQRFLDPALVELAFHQADTPLTDRERDVVRAAADGGSTSEIAHALHLAPSTVRNYLSTAFDKLGARNRTDAVRIARERGWL
ncbi:response regulator transcription factor [Microbacterium gorillae]|uniref:response regulator transcription factor n=1 Tax=Microbacterium gorillae TaxID=1231063 RepID=UPI00058AED3E|nr:response regulator transcription factor [Microbacterium gorillae]